MTIPSRMHYLKITLNTSKNQVNDEQSWLFYSLLHVHGFKTVALSFPYENVKQKYADMYIYFYTYKNIKRSICIKSNVPVIRLPYVWISKGIF